MEGSRKQKVTITFEAPGTQPPVFLCGDFTSPSWAPHELNPEETAMIGDWVEYRFSKDFEAPEGRWQYKFRLGTGDWWVCDEKTETGKLSCKV